MITEIVELAKDYGIGIAISVVLFPWVYTVDKRSRKNKENLKHVHLECHIPQGAVKDLKEEVDVIKSDVSDLKKEDHAMSTAIAEVKVELKDIKAGISEIKDIMQHFTIKGMEGK